MAEFDYDLLVIGSGPAGQRAAIQAAKLGKRVAIVERKYTVGGVQVNTGTIPSKTFREAVLDLTGFLERTFYGASYTAKQNITIADLLMRIDKVVQHEIEVIRHQLTRNGVELIGATASFLDPHTLTLEFPDARGQRVLRGEFILIATGTDVTLDPKIPFDGRRVITSDDVVRLDRLPRTLVVVGAGVVGCEYASMFAALGVRVTLIDRRSDLLKFVDDEIVDAFTYHLRDNRTTIWLNEEVAGIDWIDTPNGDGVRLHLASGKQVIAEKALYSIGRTGNTAKLNLEAAGLRADDRGRLKVNEHYQTEVPHIYAAGDVIGFPSLASTSMEQGRIAACHAFHADPCSSSDLFPYGIYSIPEISMCGRTEEELTKQGVPYEVGKAHYREIARGEIIGDTSGLLKLVFRADTHELLGVHILGEGAAELVHIGQAVLAHKGKIEYFVNTVFNYPTLAECYKVAAFDGLNRMGGRPIIESQVPPGPGRAPAGSSA
ncbi:MAG TPA: Si-specific NAD(P)(+) transhydrogenase [Bryobacteraceae bacterium]|nr:Si-specific NAD(P)(+) transhydrogenase [Bryobacteraceae bacterium]